MKLSSNFFFIIYMYIMSCNNILQVQITKMITHVVEHLKTIIDMSIATIRGYERWSSITKDEQVEAIDTYHILKFTVIFDCCKLFNDSPEIFGVCEWTGKQCNNNTKYRFIAALYLITRSNWDKWALYMFLNICERSILVRWYSTCLLLTLSWTEILLKYSTIPIGPMSNYLS